MTASPGKMTEKTSRNWIEKFRRKQICIVSLFARIAAQTRKENCLIPVCVHTTGLRTENIKSTHSTYERRWCMNLLKAIKSAVSYQLGARWLYFNYCTFGCFLIKVIQNGNWSWISGNNKEKRQRRNSILQNLAVNHLICKKRREVQISLYFWNKTAWSLKELCHGIFLHFADVIKIIFSLKETSQ